MKPEESELFTLLSKYPQLIQDNPELLAFCIRKMSGFMEGLCSVMQPFFALLADVMKPFIEFVEENK